MPPSSPQPSQDPTSSGPGSSGAPRREQRALAWGLGISLLAHLAVLFLYPSVMVRLTPDDGAPRPEEPLVQLPAMEVVQLDPLPDEPEEVEAEPEEPEPAEPVVAEPEPAEPAEPATPAVEPTPLPADVDEEAERRRLVELLTPQPGDPRLWAPLDEEYMDLTDAERAQLILHGMIQDWNDSVAIAVALSDAARDWTYTDDEGRRWGLSPGQLHLGDFSIPLPFQIGGPQGFFEDRSRERWIAEDLARGIGAQVIRETWAERARAIRERMDAEREQRRRSGGGGGEN